MDGKGAATRAWDTSDGEGTVVGAWDTDGEGEVVGAWDGQTGPETSAPDGEAVAERDWGGWAAPEEGDREAEEEEEEGMREASLLLAGIFNLAFPGGGRIYIFQFAKTNMQICQKQTNKADGLSILRLGSGHGLICILGCLDHWMYALELEEHTSPSSPYHSLHLALLQRPHHSFILHSLFFLDL